MRVLDLYCGAGMAGDGYAQAGFDVVGRDEHVRRQLREEFLKHKENADA